MFFCVVKTDVFTDLRIQIQCLLNFGQGKINHNASVGLSSFDYRPKIRFATVSSAFLVFKILTVSLSVFGLSLLCFLGLWLQHHKGNVFKFYCCTKKSGFFIVNDIYRPRNIFVQFKNCIIKLLAVAFNLNFIVTLFKPQMWFFSLYGRRSDELITTYLLAFHLWTDGIKGWHTLRQEDSLFFATAVTKIGYHPAVIYSITHVLNSVGCIYANDGIKWLATLILNNPHLCTCDLPTNTLYYLEEYVQQFCNNNRNKIKRNAEIRNALTTVLSFLVDRGSTCGYMLREQYC